MPPSQDAPRSQTCPLHAPLPPLERSQGDHAAPGRTSVAQLWVSHCPGPSSTPQGFIGISHSSVSKIISEIPPALGAVIISPPGAGEQIHHLQQQLPHFLSSDVIFGVFLIYKNITNTPRACCPFSVPAREMGAHPTRTLRAGFLLPHPWLTLLQGHSSHAQALKLSLNRPA